MLCLVDVYFNRQSAYLWGQTVLLFSPTCSFIRMTKEMNSIFQLWTFPEQLRDIYSICRRCWNVATYNWKVHNWKIEFISFVIRMKEQVGEKRSTVCPHRYADCLNKNLSLTKYVKQVLTFEFFTLYTTIPLSKRNDILKELVQLCLIIIKKNRMANVDTQLLLNTVGLILLICHFALRGE
jgi:hypothetical protein